MMVCSGGGGIRSLVCKTLWGESQRLSARTFSSVSYSSRRNQHLLSFSSGRARKRRKRQQQEQRLARLKEADSPGVLSLGQQDSSSEGDARTILDLIFPDPYRHERVMEQRPPISEVLRPYLSLQNWRVAFRNAWADYIWTWQGFWESKGLINDVGLDNRNEMLGSNSSLTTSTTASADRSNELSREIEDTSQKIQNNLRRNWRYAKTGALVIRKEIRERTGIKNTDDLRAVASEAMKLMSTSLKEFMEGYRQGRDEEVEKMLTQYFQSVAEAEKKQKEKDAAQTLTRKRRAKRRVLHRALM